MLGRFILTGALFAGGIITSKAASDAPPFQEVYDLIRTNAVGLEAGELNGAAVEGLLHKLSSEAWRIVPSRSSSTETNVASVSSTALFDESYGYVRIGNVGARLADEFRVALNKLSATNQLKGLVLDLRYAGGFDYDAATKVADRFLGSEQPLLRSRAIDCPLGCKGAR